MQNTLTVYKAGVILLLFFIVAAAGYTTLRRDAFSTCMKLPPGHRAACFDEPILNAARSGDLPLAFKLLAEGYTLDTDFAEDCHGNAHEIGATAHAHFSKGKKIEMSPLSYYCGYGFYHGFMEALLLETGDAARGASFCDSLEEASEDEMPDARGACYHGIGHGAVDGSDPQEWGDPSAMISRALSLCKEITKGMLHTNYGPLYRCTTGAYNSLEILSANPKYRLAALAGDPFAFCEGQDISYRKGCYTNMIPALMRLYGHMSFPQITAEIRTISEEEWHSDLISDLFHEYPKAAIKDPSSRQRGIVLCHSLPDPLRIGCIKGLSGGELKHGKPRLEYEGMLILCEDTMLLHDEKEICYRQGVAALRNYYSKKRTAEICRLIPTDYQKFCSARP